MKIILNKPRFTALVLVLILLICVYFWGRFSYLSSSGHYKYEEAAEGTAKIFFTPERNNVSGVMIYVRRDATLIEKENSYLVLKATDLSNPGRAKVILTQEYKTSSLPADGFIKIMFSQRLDEVKDHMISFEFYLKDNLSKDNKVTVLVTDDFTTSYYEVPKLTYTETVRGLVHEFKEQLLRDPKFYYSYGSLLMIILASITFLSLVDLRRIQKN